MTALKQISPDRRPRSCWPETGAGLNSTGVSATAITRPRYASCALALLIVLIGCSKKTDVKASVGQLEQAFPAATPAPSESPRSTPLPPADVTDAGVDANAYVKAALTAARANDLASGVLVLEELQRRKGVRGVTPNQLMTVEQAKQAMIADLAARAERGDAKAKADLAAIEKTHSQ
jgi:hypothetical protein